MKTRVLIAYVIIAVIISSISTYLIMPPKDGTSFHSEWIQNNLDAAHKINDSDIPIIGLDVDEQVGVLTIYMTDENSKEYNQAIDDLIDVPYEILSETESRELKCLRLYKEIREISRTHDMATGELHIWQHQKDLVDEYIETKCPDFPDLKFMSDNFNQNISMYESQYSSDENMVDAFKEKYSDYEITEYPNSKGVPWKYTANIGNKDVEIIFGENRTILRSYETPDKNLVCTIVNPFPKDVFDYCPPKW